VTRLTAIQGGGEGGTVPGCQVCGIPHGGECQVLRRHLDRMRQLGRARGTIRDRRYAILRMARALAPVPVLDATADDLGAWRASLDLTPAAIRVYVTHGKEFYRFLIAEGIRADNPCLGLPVPRHRRYLPRPIASKSLFTAIETAPPRIRLWLILAAYAGLRAAEIAGLTADCILTGQDPPVLIVSHGAKGGHERVVPLSAYLLGEILAANLPRTGWVFPRYDGKPGPNQPWLISQLVNNHLHSLGFRDTLHSLRHFFGTASYQGSRDLLAVSELLGHANVSTTSVYARFADPSAVKAVESIPAPPRLRVVGGGDGAA